MRNPSPTTASPSPLAPAAKPPAKDDQKLNAYPPWAIRIWQGMSMGPWVRLLASERFSVALTRIPLCCTTTFAASMNSGLALFERALWSRSIAQTRLESPPVFIIGHWRSGTTHLHELLSLDQRYACPTTYQALAPSHFLITQKWLSHLLKILVPTKRVMDNMAAGMERPQEDEFALLNLGLPSPYWIMGFPGATSRCLDALDLERLPAGELDRWRQGVSAFLQKLTFHFQKRLILKSPSHTARIRILSELFPGAQFIHIARNPAALFPSTLRLWQGMCEAQRLQRMDAEVLREYVFAAFERMYAAYDADRAALPADRLCEVRYEDLVADPLGQVAAIYEQLRLGEFDQLRDPLTKYLASQRDYQPNRHKLEDGLRAEIGRRWRGYIDRYGYAEDFS